MVARKFSLRSEGAGAYPSGEDDSVPRSVVDTAELVYANSRAYEKLVAKARALTESDDLDSILVAVDKAARCAARYHPGRLSDGALENLAFEVGLRLSDAPKTDGMVGEPAAPKDSRRRVLHVTYDVERIGGHARLIRHWIESDRSSSHSVVIINQTRGNDVREWLIQAVRRSGGNLVLLPADAPPTARAFHLRKIARSIADVVVIHTVWPDAVPIAAFSVEDCPPIILLDQCDHIFWLGGSVADLLVNLRTVGTTETAHRRHIEATCVLPVPLLEPQHVSRAEARAALGIPFSQVVLLSVGRALKYWPCGPFDFARTAGRILDRVPEAHIYVVGESKQGILRHLTSPIHERLHFVGAVEDPSSYRWAADVYLESFPFGSQNALLEAALTGLPIVPAYSPPCPTLVANEDAVSDLLPNPGSEGEYVDRAVRLIQSVEERASLGYALKERLKNTCVGDAWLRKLEAVYRQADSLTHRPQKIPESSCLTTSLDKGLGLWSLSCHSHGKAYGPLINAGGKNLLLFHKVMLARHCGDFAEAFTLALRLVFQSPNRSAAFRLLTLPIVVAIRDRASKLARLGIRSRARNNNEGF